MSEQLDKTRRDFEVLAPYYLKILDKLSDNEALKFVFYSMNSFFGDVELDYRLHTLMEEHDEDTKRWANENYDRRRARDQEQKRREYEQHRAKRADLKMSQLIEYADIDSKNHVTFKSGARDLLKSTFNVNTEKWWYPELLEFRNENGELKGYAIFAQSVGALGWMIGIDPDTEQLCFGSKLHGLTYDSERDVTIGMLGSGRFDLDLRGRNNDLEDHWME